MHPMVVEVSGGYREQGRQHGEALATVIAQITQDVIDRSKWDGVKTDRLFRQLEANFTRHAPGVLQEMQGIAEGSGLPYDDILAYNAIADVWQVHAFCTTVGWPDAPGGCLIGKTNDIGQNKEKYHQPFRRRSGDGLPAVWATWPGTVWSNCFVNAQGLAHGGASLGMKERNSDGVCSNCMYRIIMDAAGSIGEMLRLCDTVPVMHHPSHNVFADDSGDLIATELTPLGTHVCQEPGLPCARATNHFCPGPHEGRDSGEARHVENSKKRFANLGRLTAELPHTVEGMQQLLRDHAGSGQICQHANEDMWSSTAYVLVPKERMLLIAQGQPCEAEFAEVAL